MLADPIATATDLVGFCGINASAEQVANAARNCSFDKLRAVETLYGGSGNIDRFMRKGTSNQWPEYFSQEDLDYFYGEAREVMNQVGYS
jgi:hypothetical protein